MGGETRAAARQTRASCKGRIWHPGAIHSSGMDVGHAACQIAQQPQHMQTLGALDPCIFPLTLSSARIDLQTLRETRWMELVESGAKRRSRDEGGERGREAEMRVGREEGKQR